VTEGNEGNIYYGILCVKICSNIMGEVLPDILFSMDDAVKDMLLLLRIIRWMQNAGPSFPAKKQKPYVAI